MLVKPLISHLIDLVVLTYLHTVQLFITKTPSWCFKHYPILIPFWKALFLGQKDTTLTWSEATTQRKEKVQGHVVLGHFNTYTMLYSLEAERLCLFSVTVVSRWVMNLFTQLWAQPCLDEESYTCLASSPMVSEVRLFQSHCFTTYKIRAADRKWICFQHITL